MPKFRLFSNKKLVKVLVESVYIAARHAHLSLLVLSVSLFFARGVGVLMQRAWPMRAEVRWTSVGVDSALLVAGATLWVSAEHHLLQEPWLATKLTLLLVYIALGSFTLKHARTTRARWIGWVLALTVVAQMACIAITRDPLGAWVWLFPVAA